MNVAHNRWESGRAFQTLAKQCISRATGQEFSPEFPYPIGTPPRPHRFDLVSEDRRIVVECKCYTWTSGGKTPQGKISTLIEALYYMSFLPETGIRIIAINKAITPGKTETLAAYFFRTYRHLLRAVQLW